MEYMEMPVRALCRFPFRLAGLPGIWYDAHMIGSLVGRGDCGVGSPEVKAGPMAEGVGPKK